MVVGLGELGSAAAGLVVEVAKLEVDEGRLPAALAEFGGLVLGRYGGVITLAVGSGS